MHADKIVMRPLASLIPYAKNSRTHSPAQISAIAASLKEFGWTNPVLVDGDSGIIAGHARVQAAQQIGMTEAPTIELSWLTPEQRQAYIIADNRLSELAGWDNDMLRLELGSLRDVGFGLSLTGFGELDLSELFGGASGIGEGAGRANASLAEEFGVPPFSVLNAREGWWQERKRVWLALGIRSEVGRGENALDMSAAMTGVSDPAARADWNAKRRANATPGGSAMPAAHLVNGKTVQRDGRGRRKANAIPGGG